MTLLNVATSSTPLQSATFTPRTSAYCRNQAISCFDLGLMSAMAMFQQLQAITRFDASQSL
jgi:hypothetical protein